MAFDKHGEISVEMQMEGYNLQKVLEYKYLGNIIGCEESSQW